MNEIRQNGGNKVMVVQSDITNMIYLPMREWERTYELYPIVGLSLSLSNESVSLSIARSLAKC